MILTPTTELEAVNLMLSTIGEAPVATLDSTDLLDVTIAQTVLRETSRSVQSEGWHFNTEVDYELPLTADGQIAVAPNVLQIDTTSEYKSYDVVQRGGFLYNRAKRTSVFDKALKVDMTLFLGYDEMPEAARHYIAVKASRIFQDRVMGADALHVYTQADEERAYGHLKRAEGETGDFNMFSDSSSVLEIWDR